MKKKINPELLRAEFSDLPEYRGAMKLVALVILSGILTAIFILWVVK
jgi:hypothetical protein